MRKICNVIKLFAFVLLLTFGGLQVKAASKVTYKGNSSIDGSCYKFVTNYKTVSVYQDGEYQDSFKLVKIKKNLYKLKGLSAVRMKKTNNYIKIYFLEGNICELPFLGNYYRTSYRSTKLQGTYIGEGNYGQWNAIVLNKNKTYKVYADRKLYSKGKLVKVKNGVYKLKDSPVIRIKLYGHKVVIDAADGRGGKIPFGGTFYRK